MHTNKRRQLKLLRFSAQKDKIKTRSVSRLHISLMTVVEWRKVQFLGASPPGTPLCFNIFLSILRTLLANFFLLWQFIYYSLVCYLFSLVVRLDDYVNKVVAHNYNIVLNYHISKQKEIFLNFLSGFWPPWIYTLTSICLSYEIYQSMLKIFHTSEIFLTFLKAYTNPFLASGSVIYEILTVQPYIYEKAFNSGIVDKSSALLLKAYAKCIQNHLWTVPKSMEVGVRCQKNINGHFCTL